MECGLWSRVMLVTIILAVLMSTVFYEEPSCTTANNSIDLIKFFVPFVLAVLLSEFIIWLCQQPWKPKKKDCDGDDNDTYF